MIDVSLGTDSIRWKNISHGSRTEAYTNTKYYIASPIGTTSKFTVKYTLLQLENKRIPLDFLLMEYHWDSFLLSFCKH